MELSRIQKFVNEHVDASLPAESQTLILSSDMELMGGDNAKYSNNSSGTCNSVNQDCTNYGANCDKSHNGTCNSGIITIVNNDRDKCK